VGAVHVQGLGWWNGEGANNVGVGNLPCRDGAHSRHLEVAHAWARCAFMISGQFMELPVWARCTFRAWMLLPLGRGAHL
jgi:hypothetical protein